MSYFDQAYLSTPPWDIGKEQGAFRRLEEKITINGPILDLGCGTGENSLFFASKGFEVTGIDTSHIAISKALEKAAFRQLHDKATFLTHDLFKVDELGQKFSTVIDSGVFHMFDSRRRYDYQKSLKKVLQRNGQLFILAFSYLEPLGIGPPQRLTKDDYINIFSTGWVIKNFEHEEFETTITTKHARALLTTIERI